MQPLSLDTISHLPAYGLADELCRTLDACGQVVVTAPPGAGKSTVLPLLILEHLREGKILLLEPRRLAARQVAERMAELLGEKLGETIGYRVRFESCVSDRTRIEVVTEGVLTRMLVSDPLLEGVAVVIFDEVHERSLQTDLSLALARDCRAVVRPDLRLVLMSATIDADRICRSLEAPLLHADGRCFPVRIHHEETDHIARTLYRIFSETEGDILTFLPGEKEITTLADRLREAELDAMICPLYGQLSPEEQRRAIRPARDGRRKVVLATSIAETSLTIEGVRIVIDSGLCRRPVVDPATGLTHLETATISLDMAEQRAGRAGRVAEGDCYRLYSLATEHRMSPTRQPEVEEADLSDLLLTVAAWGERHPERLPWLTPLPQGHLEAARSLLLSLGALTPVGELTERGRRMAAFPCAPRLAAMFLAADTNQPHSPNPPHSPNTAHDSKRLAACLAAALEERSPMAYRRAVQSFARMLRVQPLEIGQEACFLSEEAGRLLASAYPERLAQHESNGAYRMASGDTAYLDENHPFRGHAYLVIPSLNRASGRVFAAAPVAEKDMLARATDKTTVRWDSKSATVLARREKRVGAIVLRTQPLVLTPDVREEVLLALAETAPKDGLSMFDWSDDVTAMQNRLSYISRRHPELELPDCSTEAVLAAAAEWLPLCAKGLDLRRIDLTEVVWGRLSYEQQQQVDRLAPVRVMLPNGHSLRLEYRPSQECPVLRVRLQECFGMQTTPLVDGEPILMELLSPGFKPVQLTRDLHSFWQTTYFDVRKELKRRYPKHAWPDNPTNH